MKSKLVFAIFASILTCPVFGQFVTDFQAVYPFNNGVHSTKNYTFTKDNNLISSKVPGYMLMANSAVSNSAIALSALKLNPDFTISYTRSYLPSTIENVTNLVANDVISTSDGFYIACGKVSYYEKAYAFIAAFDMKLNPVWYTEYPGVTTLNAIIDASGGGVKEIKYIACGSYGTSYPSGVIMGINPIGNPVWMNTTKAISKSDKFVYNDLIAVSLINIDMKWQCAIVGNAITYPGADKNVLLTLVDIKGNLNYSYLYGLPNNTSICYDEEGYGLTMSPKNDIVITGRTKCYYVQLPAIRWDDALLFAVDIKGNIHWSLRYDIPKNNATGEYAQKVLAGKENLYISGYYQSYVFNEKGSYDAFAFETYLDGTPTQVRVYGDQGEDLFYAQEINHASNGLISVGFSSSFYPSSTKFSYAPYVVESYAKIKELCHSQIFKLPYEKVDLKINKIDCFLTETKCLKKKLYEIKNPAIEYVVCPKKPWISDTIISVKSAEDIVIDVEQNMKIYPNPVRTNHLTIEGAEINSQFKIYSIMGNLVKEGTLNEVNIDITDLLNGIYFIHINDIKKSVSIKFIKE